MIVFDKNLSEVYVRLLDEGVEVWRPVSVRKIDPITYEIADKNADDEVWEFDYGDKIHALAAVAQDGSTFHIAIRCYVGWSALEFAAMKTDAKKYRNWR